MGEREDMNNKAVCFFGHRKIPKNEELRDSVREVMEDLINNENVDTFYLGSKSEFNDLCKHLLCELKEKYPHIIRIYVRAEFPYIDDDYRNYLLRWCDDTYYPESMINAGKAAYVERNCEMIDKSDFCVVYYTEGYAPPRRKNSRRDLFDYQPKSGTGVAFDYAVKKKKIIINLAENCTENDK